MEEQDFAYFARRAAEERRAAAEAASPAAERAHRELASQFAELAGLKEERFGGAA